MCFLIEKYPVFRGWKVMSEYLIAMKIVNKRASRRLYCPVTAVILSFTVVSGHLHCFYAKRQQNKLFAIGNR